MITVSFFTKPHYEIVKLVDQNDPAIAQKFSTSNSVKISEVEFQNLIKFEDIIYNTEMI
jgi:hypothetical protein